jgi:hypothetical protein
VHAVHTVVAADVAAGLKPICWKYYPGMDCQMMWGLLSKCNKALKVNLADKKTWPAAGAAIKIVTLDSPLKSPVGTGSYRASKAAIKDMCDCGAKVKVTKASSWMAIAIGSYPKLPLVRAMTYLQMCNPSVSAGAVVPPGTALVGICDIPKSANAANTNGSSSGTQPMPGCSCGAYVAGTTAASIDKIAQGVCKQCDISAIKKAIYFCNTGSFVSIDNMYPGYKLALPCISSPTEYHAMFTALMRPRGGAPSPAAASKPANSSAAATAKAPTRGLKGWCNWARFQPTIGPQTGLIYLDSACEWDSNGCSGPSWALQYQNELTACCNGHDMCYQCAAQSNGWAGLWGRRLCDSQFLSGMYSTCNAHWPNFAWWAWGDAWHRSWCRSTAELMYTAVWVYQEALGYGLDPMAGHACTSSWDVAWAYYWGDKCYTRP